MNMVHVFGTTFEYFTAPTWVQFRIRQFVAKWGSTNLDTRAPVCVRMSAFLMLRKFGLPGTPIVNP